MKTIEKDQTSIIKHEELYNNIIVLNGKLDEYLVQVDMQNREIADLQRIIYEEEEEENLHSITLL